MPFELNPLLATRSSPEHELRRAEAEERRVAAQRQAALANLCPIAQRRRGIEDRLQDEYRPAVLAALLREYDALKPLLDAAEDLVNRLSRQYTIALARLYAVGGRR